MDSEDLAAFDFLVGAMAVFLFYFSASRRRRIGRGRCDRSSLIAVWVAIQLDRKFPAVMIDLLMGFQVPAASGRYSHPHVTR